MTEYAKSLIENYGYWVVFFGAMIEGESIILTASALAAAGLLSIKIVGCLTFVGTLLADQSIYMLGTHYGPKTLNYLKNRFPFLKDSIERGLTFLKKHEIPYILSFRFIYGIRIISPFLIGAQHVPFLKFSYLNMIAAALWTAISCFIGYSIGHFFHRFTQNLGIMVATIVFLLVLFSISVSHYKKKKRQKQSSQSLDSEKENSDPEI